MGGQRAAIGGYIAFLKGDAVGVIWFILEEEWVWWKGEHRVFRSCILMAKKPVIFNLLIFPEMLRFPGQPSGLAGTSRAF